MKRTINLLREFSFPLIAGVLVALVWANISPETYKHFNYSPLIGELDFHFLINDIFMVFFFGIATVEITESLLPGGALNPIKKAVNPLLSTLGGVIGPALVYTLLNIIWGKPEFARGWGIPTATDIALAWLVARFIFGNKHPAVPFLLLLAIVDDGIGLAIIAIFYPDIHHPVVPVWLLLVLAGMVFAFILRKRGVKHYWPYIFFGGIMSWTGLAKAHLHPALALVFIVPFMPSPKRMKHELFEDDLSDHSTLMQFEHDFKVFIDFGLFLFGLSNAGVEFSAVNELTWIVFLAILTGKTIGIFS
jgi:NhaA family Na+:H+ antiporter